MKQKASPNRTPCRSCNHGILAVGVVAYNGYTNVLKLTLQKQTWMVTKLGLKKALCEVKGGNDSALWDKTQCHVLLSTSNSDIARTAGIISIILVQIIIMIWLNILNIYKPQEIFLRHRFMT